MTRQELIDEFAKKFYSFNKLDCQALQEYLEPFDEKQIYKIYKACMSQNRFLTLNLVANECKKLKGYEISKWDKESLSLLNKVEAVIRFIKDNKMVDDFIAGKVYFAKLKNKINNKPLFTKEELLILKQVFNNHKGLYYCISQGGNEEYIQREFSKIFYLRGLSENNNRKCQST